MACYISQRRFAEFIFSLEKASIKQHIPYMGALELTYRCNQNCCHCYCNLGLNDRRKEDELELDDIKRILDEIADAGCLWILFTGGEVLIREDFWDIYLYALKKGMLIEIFTNATLINEGIARQFALFPPFGIGISIYGSSPSLHDNITRVKGSFERTMNGIAWLQKYKLKFSLKTIAMTLNYLDLKGMQELSEDLGAWFYCDTLICQRIDGGTSPVKYRIDVDKMVGLDIDEEKHFKECEETFASFWNKRPEEALNCGAGVFAFNINPYGSLSPCTMFLSFQYSLREMPFKDAWKRIISDYSNRQNDFIPRECLSCSMLCICSRCPAWAELEAKSLNEKVNYLCEYARHLEKAFFAKKEEVEDAKKILSEARD